MNKLYDYHHVNFYQKQHEAMDVTRTIRQNKKLIIPMDCNVHRHLHKDITNIPPLSVPIAQCVLKHMQDYPLDESYISNIENYQHCIEDALKHPKARPSEVMVAQLAIHLLDLQKPYIQYGSVPPQYIYHPHPARWERNVS